MWIDLLKALPVVYSLWIWLKKTFSGKTSEIKVEGEGSADAARKYVKVNSIYLKMTDAIILSPDEDLYQLFVEIVKDNIYHGYQEIEIIIDMVDLKKINSKVERHLKAFVDWASRNESIPITLIFSRATKFKEIKDECIRKAEQNRKLFNVDFHLYFK